MPTISVDISQARGPAVRAAVLALHPKPKEGEGGYIEGETDIQWMQRVLRRRFRRMIVAMMKKANRNAAVDPDPGIPED